jgi:hypothetical protein
MDDLPVRNWMFHLIVGPYPARYRDRHGDVVSRATQNKRGVANRAEDTPRARRAGADAGPARAPTPIVNDSSRASPAGRKMMVTIKTVKASFCALLLSLGLATATTAPAEAQFQQGLVNVAVGDIETGDILSNNNVVVGVAANIAANVCGIAVNPAVLSLQLVGGGVFKCENHQDGKFVQIAK